MIVNQSLFWALGYQKYRRATSRTSRGEGALFRIIVRDNSLALVVLTGMVGLDQLDNDVAVSYFSRTVLLCGLAPYDFYIKQRGHVIFWYDQAGSHRGNSGLN